MPWRFQHFSSDAIRSKLPLAGGAHFHHSLRRPLGVMSNLCHGGEFAQVADPVVRGELGEVLVLAVAVGDGAGCNSGTAAGFHVGGGIAHEETVLGPGAHGGQGGEEDIRGRFAREAVGALHVVEVPDQAELLEDGAGGRAAFGGGGALAAAEHGQAFGNAGVNGGLVWLWPRAR